MDLLLHQQGCVLLVADTTKPTSSLSSTCCRATYLVRLEAVRLLIVLVSSQLYSPLAAGPPEAHPFTTALMQQPDLAAGLVQVHIRACRRITTTRC